MATHIYGVRVLDIDPKEMRVRFKVFAVYYDTASETFPPVPDDPAFFFFLLWEAFQPVPTRVDHESLGRLVTVADAAASAGLRILPTLFTGHMSGVDWIPGWALGGTERGLALARLAGTA